jgi:hypothetical protein
LFKVFTLTNDTLVPIYWRFTPLRTRWKKTINRRGVFFKTNHKNNCIYLIPWISPCAIDHIKCIIQTPNLIIIGFRITMVNETCIFCGFKPSINQWLWPKVIPIYVIMTFIYVSLYFVYILFDTTEVNQNIPDSPNTGI